MPKIRFLQRAAGREVGTVEENADRGLVERWADESRPDGPVVEVLEELEETAGAGDELEDTAPLVHEDRALRSPRGRGRRRRRG